MSSFEQRVRLTNIVENYIQELFPKDKCTIKKFGCETILGEDADTDFWKFVKEPEANQQASSMIVKFAPDFLLLKKSKPSKLYFVEVKHSIAPTWLPQRLEKLKKKNSDNTLSTDRIGVVAREALLAYRRYYPSTIILMACPYNAKLLMAQFAKDIRCLYCYHSKEREDYDCTSCPEKMGGFFDLERDINSEGSQTPMTNVDLNSFRPADEFFLNELGIRLNENILNNLLGEIKQESIEIDEKVEPKLKNLALWNINHAGCDWVDYEVYSFPGNDFYHLDRECTCMRGNEDRMVAYATLAQALRSGKKTYCRMCCPKTGVKG